MARTTALPKTNVSTESTGGTNGGGAVLAVAETTMGVDVLWPALGHNGSASRTASDKQPRADRCVRRDPARGSLETAAVVGP